jgi:hypothetical protein
MSIITEELRDLPMLPNDENFELMHDEDFFFHYSSLPLDDALL